MRFTVFIAEDNKANLREITEDVGFACQRLDPPLRRDIDFSIATASEQEVAKTWIDDHKDEKVLYIFDLLVMNDEVHDFDGLVKARLTQPDSNPVVVITSNTSAEILKLLKKAHSAQRFTGFVDRMTGTVSTYREQLRVNVIEGARSLLARE